MKKESSPPIVPASVVLPEITPKAIVLSVILAAILAAANAYLGLFAGMTVSASIPAAVVSMAVLRLFRRSNILENNIVQTAASSGEALAAGIIFTIPALLLVGYWTSFDYRQTTVIGMVGGLLGVLFTIPLRRALIVTAGLRFPEGVATAEVLKVGAAQGSDPAGGAAAQTGAEFRTLLVAGLLGAGAKVGESGMGLWSEALEWAGQAGRSVLYVGINLSAALLGVGFIIGLNTASVVFIGGVLGWLVLLPIFGLMADVAPGADSFVVAKQIWSSQIRYVGIGAMLVGGIWTLTKLREPVWSSLVVLREQYRASRRLASAVPRTERDASLPWILIPLGVSVIPMAWIYTGVVESMALGLAMTALMLVAAFLFSSVAGYMAGLVGSSSNPVSGVTIATIMLASLLLVAAIGQGHSAGPAAALVIGGVVCCAAAMGGDNLQDLKTGHLVGATPWKQQIMQVVGVATGAITLAPVLALLQAKYGIGDPTETHAHPLTAPQATLMAHLTKSVFGGALPWHLVALGMVVGLAIIALDRRQEAKGSTFRLPVLAVALGVYLPFKLSAAIFAGGLVAALVQRSTPGETDTSRGGLLFAAGLVTGEALLGIALAVPVAVSGFWPSVSADPLKLFSDPPVGAWPGLVVMIMIATLLYRTATRLSISKGHE
jgi:putative OPT family oligopeptide transporter